MDNISKLEFVSELNSISKQNTPNHGICLFLGAGADISSGGILFSDLKKECINIVSNRNIHDFELSDNVDKEFDRIMESLDEDSRSMVIEYLIKQTDEWLPSDGYKLLILLAQCNCISSVITTNFANLLEITQKQIGIDAFQIFTPATAVPAKYLINSKSQKSIYLKMHGDINGKLITHLTSSEIKNKTYQKEYIKLFEHLIQNETLVFLGYSGWDTKIAEIFERNKSKVKNVYWCNIQEPDQSAPLIKIFNQNNIKIKYLKYNFDEALQTIAIEFFKDRALYHVDSIFIWALIKSKIKKLNLEFFKNIETETKDLLLVKRTKSHILDDFIIDIDKNICFLTGDSGVGKSILVSEFCKTYNSSEDISVIPLNIMTTYSSDLLDYIVKKLGYISKDAYTLFYQFSRWAKEQNKYFIFIIDNLGNQIGSIKEIAALINRLIEIAYAVRKQHHIKFIITLRTNIWNNIYKLLDINYLNSIIWNDYKENTNYSVRLGNFDNYETEMAKFNLLSLLQTDKIPNYLYELMKEPLLYALIQKNINIIGNINELNIYDIFEKTFFNGFSKIFLEKLAYHLFCNYIDINSSANFKLELFNIYLRNDILVNMLTIEENKIEFKNDLIFECCLASYFNTNNYIDTFLLQCKDFERMYLSIQLPNPMYNGIIRYLGALCDDFGKVIKLIHLVLIHNEETSKFTKKFINDIFKYMALYNPKEYSNNIINFDIKYEEFLELLPFLIHSIGFMKDTYAFPSLAFLRNVDFLSYKLECNILINDRFSMGLRKACTFPTLEKYFNDYIGYYFFPEESAASLFSLLWIMGRIGKDNTALDIYNGISKLVTKKIKETNYRITDKDILAIKKSFLENSYFIFFNANNNLEKKYYLYPKESKMIPIIHHVKKKRDLTSEQLVIIKSLVDHFDETIEFFVCNYIFVYMAIYDLDYALKNLDALYATFDENTNVLELDFYSSALFLCCYIANPIDRELYVIRYNQMVEDFEIKMFISPSMQRLSSCLKFEL